jgi:hypothetical protein
MPRASTTARTSVRATNKKEVVEELIAVEEILQQEVQEELVEIEKIEEAITELESQNDIILLHFVRDGVTAFGTVWYAGQEIEVERGSEYFRQTLDRNGNSWLDRSEEDRLEKGPLSWKLGPSEIKNELIEYPENFDPHGMTYHKGEWLDLTMLRLRAEKEVARGRNIPNN